MNNVEMTLNFSKNMQQKLLLIRPSLTNLFQQHNLQEQGADGSKIMLQLTQNDQQNQDAVLDGLADVFRKHNIDKEEGIEATFTSSDVQTQRTCVWITNGGFWRCT